MSDETDERVEQIFKRLIQASGEAGWEMRLASLHMDGRNDYAIHAKGQPGIKAVLTANQWDAEFVTAAKDDILWLINRISTLEMELASAQEKIDRLV